MSEPAPSASRISRICDVVAVIAAMIALTVYATGGFREWTPFGRLSMTTWIRPLGFAVILLAIRHWLQPRPSILSRLVAGLRFVWQAPETRICLPIVLGTRTAVFLAGFLAIVLFGYRTNVEVPWRIYENEFLNLPARWDTGWYMGVAVEGYVWNPRYSATHQQNIAFFPAYPLTVRYLSLLLGRETLWTGVLIAWVAFLGALVYMFRLARERLGDEAAGASVAFIAAYPFALFFGTAYTESLFLLAIVGACYHFERDELWQAGLWGLLAGLSRPNGCLLSIVLALMAIRPLWPHGWRVWRPALPPPIGWMGLADRIAAAAAPGIGMLIYSTYIYFLTGNPLQWALQNAAWGRVYRGIDFLVTQHATLIGERGIYTYAATRTVDTLQVAAILFVLASVWPVLRRLGVPYAALILINVLPPLMMGGLLSMGRVTSVLFPTFLWLGAAVPAAHRPAWLVVFAMLQAICAAMFFTWRPLY
jgi:hypothetical protein